jgi:AcrR family transcriptional regulator
VSDSSDHVLDAAERLFLERGYSGTRLRDIADVLGFKHASLYHHAPRGKKELWDRVLDRTFARHKSALDQARESSPNLEGQLVAMGAWLLSQPAMNVAAMASADLPGSPQAHDVAMRIYRCVMAPIAEAFRAAAGRGETRELSSDLLAGMFVASFNGVVATAPSSVFPRPVDQIAAGIVDVLLRGSLIAE